MLLIGFLLGAIIAPSIARSVTIENPHIHQSDTYGVLLESAIILPALSPSAHSTIALSSDGAIRASYAPKYPLEGEEETELGNTTKERVQREIERVFGPNHIMYWVAVNESGLDPFAESGTGPVGVLQIAGITWKQHKCTGDRYDYVANIRCGKRIYDANGLKDWRWSEFHGSRGGWNQNLSTSVGG